MKVFITGSQGQLGQALQQIIPSNLCIPFSHKDLDISNYDQVCEAIRLRAPELVVNAAAYNRVDKAEADRETAFLVNETGPKNLALATNEIGIPLVHVSTDYVFDGQKTEPYTEEDEPHPISAYGESKLAGELAVLASNPKAYVVRTAWVFSEGGSNFYKTILKMAGNNELFINDDQCGCPTYAPDLALGILELVKTKKPGLYHLAGAGATTRYKAVSKLFELLGLGAQLNPVATDYFKTAAKRPMYSVMESSKIEDISLRPWNESLVEFAQKLDKSFLPKFG